MRRALFELAVLAAISALLAAGGWAAFGREKKQPRPGPGEASAGQVELWGASTVLWVDARTEAEFSRGKIPGALPLHPATWDAQLPAIFDRWEPERATVVYGDGRSDTAHAVAHRLREEAKLNNVWVLQGGLPAWRGR